MKCPEVQEFLFEYVEASLPQVKRAEVEAHVAACEACAEAVRREKQIAGRLSSTFRENVQTLALGKLEREHLLSALTSPRESSQPRWARVLAERWVGFTAALGTAAA